MRSSLRTPVVVGVDIGTTNLKIVALDEDGTVVARAVRPTPRDSLTLQIDAAELVGVIEDLLTAVCGGRYQIAAVSTAGMGEDGVLTDARGATLTRALAWFDPRRQELFTDLLPDLGPHAPVDVAPDPTRGLVGWRWARRQVGHGDGITWLALADIAAAVWTDRSFLSDTIASRTGAWDSSHRSWVDEYVVATLGSLEALPPVLAAGEVVGGFRGSALRAEGVVAPDAIVVAGGHDHPIGGWGVDRMAPGVVLDSMGTAEVVVTQSRSRAVSPPIGVDSAPGIRSSGSTVLRVEEVARNVQWASAEPDVARHLRDLLSGRERPLSVLRSGYFLPGVRGGGEPSYAPDAPRDAHARASAVLGALAISGRDAIAAVRAATPGAGEVRQAGGWLRSPGWVDIKAEIEGARSAPILEPQVTAVGAALLAAEACGWTPDPARALSGFTALLH